MDRDGNSIGYDDSLSESSYKSPYACTTVQQIIGSSSTTPSYEQGNHQ